MILKSDMLFKVYFPSFFEKHGMCLSKVLLDPDLISLLRVPQAKHGKVSAQVPPPSSRGRQTQICQRESWPSAMQLCRQ